MIELPEPNGYYDQEYFRGPTQREPCYTADQLRTYGDQRAAEARELMREDCVKVCRDVVSVPTDRKYQQGYLNALGDFENAIKELS